jgi:hypothetical protein
LTVSHNQNMEIDQLKKILSRQEVLLGELDLKANSTQRLEQSKRTPTRIEAEWEAIDKLWQEFNENHEAIKGLSADQLGPYKSMNYYENGQKQMEKVRRIVLSVCPEILGASGENIPKPGVSSPVVTNDEDGMHQFMALLIQGLKESNGAFLAANQSMLESVLKSTGDSKKNRPSHNEIKQFSGEKIKDYQSFKATFESIIGKSQISKVEKLTHLRAKLTNQALELIAHLQLLDQNYDRAWDLLNGRYQDKRALFEAEIEALFNLPEIRTNDMTSLSRLTDTMRESIYNLQGMQIDITACAPIIAYLAIRKFNPTLREDFETAKGVPGEIPSLASVDDFLDAAYKKMRIISMGAATTTKQRPRARDTHTHLTTQPPQSSTERIKQCLVCTKGHLTTECPMLKTLTDPGKEFRNKKICIYCGLHKFVYKDPCRKRKFITCGICQGSHATELHKIHQQQETSSVHTIKKETPSTNPSDTAAFLSNNHSEQAASSVILPTAVIQIMDSNGNWISLRCLVDQCSQSSYITEDVVQRLRLKKKDTNIKVTAVGGIVTDNIKKLTTVKANLQGEMYSFKALVIKRITGNLPAYHNQRRELLGLENLADPNFYKPGPIHILLGSNIIPSLMMDGVKKVGGFLLQKTKMGWMVSGSDSGQQSLVKYTSTYATLAEFDQEIRAFWDLPIKTDITDEDEDKDHYCENLFATTHKRSPDGRYEVPTPWIKDAPALGSSYQQALGFYLHQERQLRQDEEHRSLFNDFMQEYEDLGHMEASTKNLCDTTGHTYYLPYFSVLRKDALTTKVRNVFNASSKTSNGVSLNDTIYAGPKLQASILGIITKARQWKYIYSSDISKMFRQILLLPEDQERIRVLWRPKPTEPIQEYNMKTVTYGVDCAPWQAIRTIKQLAIDESPSEQIKNIISNSFYMDDLLHGADTVETCQSEIQQIKEVMLAGGFPLTKWASNVKEVLELIPNSEQINYYLGEAQTWKTLGLIYNPTQDIYCINVKPWNHENIHFTKRGLLSMVASLYDPMGWILPTVMNMRMALQSLWIKDYNWDTPLDEIDREKFRVYIEEIKCLTNIQIPRWIGTNKNTAIELVGFSDASGVGHAAVIYSRVKTPEGIITNLVAARGRVNPIKSQAAIDKKILTIPKMELESIILLTQLYLDIIPNFQHNESSFTAYTDSKIALDWSRSPKLHENKMIGRRVKKIKEVLNPRVQLHHVRSEENPADPASRGLSPRNLRKCDLWFNGPSWLKEPTLPTTPMEGKVERKFQPPTVQTLILVNTNEILDRFSTMSKALKVLTWVRRWLTKKRGILEASEITATRLTLIKLHQQEYFKGELIATSASRNLQKTSRLFGLNPFLDKEGILRIGGRLANATHLAEDTKHPIIMDAKGQYTKLLIQQAHYEYRHAGRRLMENIIRGKYWIPNLKTQIKRIYQACLICRRFNARTGQQIMADLPKDRVQPSPIFAHCGVDLCGPFLIKSGRTRNAPTTKHWVVVYICFYTKLIHLELVSELSTVSFLASFQRFCARRGTPTIIMSDNGTNFVGAQRLLNTEWMKITTEGKIAVAAKEIEWRFIPSLSPTVGGFWEAAVKAFKYFLKRANNLTSIGYEEFNTLICQIEAILNSRPLYALTSNPEELDALTPGHFAVQRNLLLPPTPRDASERPTITKRWLTLQSILNGYWEVFQESYLQTLQKRSKWFHQKPNIQIGDLVLLKEPNTKARKWKLGRVTQTYPDPKGNVRKADVRTDRGEFQRGINMIIPLLSEEGPTENSPEEIIETPRSDPDEFIVDQTNIVPEEEPVTGLESNQDNTKDSISETEQLTDSSNPSNVKESSSTNRYNLRVRMSKGSKSGPMKHTLLLITILSLISLVASTITNITTPVAVWKTGLAQMQAYNIHLTVDTGINITSDFTFIDYQQKLLENFCQSEDLRRTENLRQHCQDTVDSLAEEAASATKRLKETYAGKRNKRWLSSSIFHSVKTIAPYFGLGVALKSSHGIKEMTKDIDTLTTTLNTTQRNKQPRGKRSLLVQGLRLSKNAIPWLGGLSTVAMGIELVRMEGHMEQLRNSMKKMVHIILNDTKIGFEEVDGRINDILLAKKESELMEEIDHYAILYLDGVIGIVEKHNGLENYIPIDLWNATVQQLNNGTGRVKLPRIGDGWNIRATQRNLVNETVSLTYELPVALADDLTEYTIVSIPVNQRRVLLETNAMSQQLLVDPRNQTYLVKSKLTEIYPGLYKHSPRRKLPTCSLKIIQQGTNLPLPKECLSIPADTVSTSLFAISPTQTVVIPDEQNTTLTCNTTTFEVTKAIMIEDEKCFLDSTTFYTTIEKEEVTVFWKDIAPNTAKQIQLKPGQELSPFNTSHLIHKMELDLQQEIDGIEPFKVHAITWVIIGVTSATTIVGLILCLLYLINKYFRSTNQQGTVTEEVPMEILTAGFLTKHLGQSTLQI